VKIQNIQMTLYDNIKDSVTKGKMDICCKLILNKIYKVNVKFAAYVYVGNLKLCPAVSLTVLSSDLGPG